MESIIRNLIRRIPGNTEGQVLVEYVVLIAFCVLLIVGEIQLLMIAANSYVQGIYFLLVQTFP
jgi:hypothetical protein